ncbi:MAG: tetratricopeptide repeat protein [Nitrospirota bacterium]|nr:tetratricopeptide repeat protein [Nitrospirota bacterium]
MEDALQQALRLQREGNLVDAEKVCRQALAARPGDPAVSHQLGIMLLQCGRAAEAAPLLETAARAVPDRPGLHLPLGIACFFAGRDEQAAAAFARELDLTPNHPNALYWTGMVLSRRGQQAEAIAQFERAIAARPDLLEAHINLGQSRTALGDTAGAVRAFEQALRIHPNLPDVLAFLGAALCQAGDIAAGIHHLERAAALAPDAAPIRFELGRALLSAGRATDSLPHLQAAATANPDTPQWREVLGKALQQDGQYDAAATTYTRLLETHPERVANRLELARACLSGNQHDKTLPLVERALAENPDDVTALLLAAQTHQRLAHAEQAMALYQRAAQQFPGDWAIGEPLLWALVYRSDLDPVAVRAQAEELVRNYFPRPPEAEPYRNGPAPERRLTIGYLSPDFRTHAVAFFLENILVHHDRSRFTVCCYSNTAYREDQVTSRLRSLAGHWVDIGRMDAAQAAASIRAERVDILIDLAGNSPHGRLDVMALSPAPVQVTYLGSPMTTGLDAIDYRLTDARADPPGAEAHCSETLVRLPGAFLCYRPPRDAPDPAPPPSVQGGHITFGSFNNFPKLNPRLVATWAEVLQAVPNSRMLIKARSVVTRAGRDTLLEWFAHAGIGEDRLELVDMVPVLTNHLDMYRHMDIALDTFPYNGTTTTCEALWMGVPVVVLAGDRHMGRVGVSLLTTLGLEELIAPTQSDYVRIAAALATDPQRLETLRRELRQRVASSPLCNGKTFTGDFEATLRGLWREWCEGQRTA